MKTAIATNNIESLLQGPVPVSTVYSVSHVSSTSLTMPDGSAAVVEPLVVPEKMKAGLAQEEFAWAWVFMLSYW
jgi:hypothetical protein